MTSTNPSKRGGSPRSLETLAWGLAAALAALAAVKLSHGFERLLLAQQDGAVDLKLRYDETRAWFSGYWIRGAVYPPASQAMLWPIVGWLPFQAVRGLWGMILLGCLAWLSALCARGCGLRSTAAKTVCALLPLALSSTSSAIGIGQLVPVFLPLVVTAVLWMARGPSRWADSAGIAVLFTLAAVKPTLFAPFAWLVLLLPRSPRPAILSGALYVTLTLVALMAIRGHGGPAKTTLGEVVAGGVDKKMEWATTVKPLDGNRTTLFGGGYGNLQNMSQNAGLVGLQTFILPIASVLACGAWIARRRRTDPWILLGACALAARLGWYHRIYDDMLVVLPAIALTRIIASRGRAGGVDDGIARVAVALLGATLVPAIVPAKALPLARDVLGTIAPAIWFLDLLFLAHVAPAFEPPGERRNADPERQAELVTDMSPGVA